MQVNIHKEKEKDQYSYALLKASWLQKSIRRGDMATSLAIADLYVKDGQIEGLKRRLWVYACEDIGLGTPEILILMAEKDNYQDQIKILCQSYKNRECDRFLLQTTRNKAKYLNIPEIEREVKAFLKLIQLTDVWFSNKRLKINLENVKEYFEKLKKQRDEEWVKKSLDIALDKYILLSKHKVFGARTLLAFSVLLALRPNITKINKEYDFKEVELRKLDIVDDYALDKHTSFGKKLNRGEAHWIKVGSVVIPERTYPDQYLKDLQEKYPY